MLANAMRATGLGARALAAAIDVAPAVVSRWQTGSRQPRGPARALLRVLAREPEAALRALGQELPLLGATEKAATLTMVRTPDAHARSDHVSADDARGFAGDGPPPGYTGGQED